MQKLIIIITIMVVLENFDSAVSVAQKSKTNYAKIPVPKLGYKEIIKEVDFPNLTLAHNDTKIGRVQRALRWENIVRAVEKRYGIPKNYILGMICVESEGDPTQPNLSSDGGLGLIHMQPYMASKYGMELITDSKKMVDKRQGKKINHLIDAKDSDLKELIEYDDRFHPIKNLDAAARMLCDLRIRLGSWNRALKGFSGRRTYAPKVINYAKNILNKKFMNMVAKDFNRRNESNKVLGKKLTFKVYISVFHNLNRNYGLVEYSKLKK